MTQTHIDDVQMVRLNLCLGESLEDAHKRLIEADPDERVVPGTFRLTNILGPDGSIEFVACATDCYCPDLG